MSFSIKREELSLLYKSNDFRCTRKKTKSNISVITRKKMVYPAQIYNEKRCILFSTFHDSKNGGVNKAFEYLENYKNCLESKSYIGLKAELEFYKKYGDKFSLTVAGDMGDHTDFTGCIDSNMTRIDVTTCIELKSLKEYEPFLTQGKKYKIAVMDKQNWQLVDLVDISFPLCSCGNSFQFKIAVMMGENYNRQGESQWTHDQKYIEICPICFSMNILDTISTHFMFQINEFEKNIPYTFQENKKQQEIENYKANVFRYLKKQIDPRIMGLGEFICKTNAPDGDGNWGIDFSIVNNLVTEYLGDFIETCLIE